jgi:hypothetical protein
MTRLPWWILIAALLGCASVQNGNALREIQDLRASQRAATEQCWADMSTPELDPLRSKVEIPKKIPDAAPPFSILANDTFPDEVDRSLILKWAALRDVCIARVVKTLSVPAHADINLQLVLQAEYSVVKGSGEGLDELLVALYHQKLTYGEFAKKRYELGRDEVEALHAIQQSAADRDEARRAQAQQQFANTLTAWSAYMQAVNARQPQSLLINGTIQVH